jgi:hypothetical protein
MIYSYFICILIVLGFEHALKNTGMPTIKKAYLRMYFISLLIMALIWIGKAYLKNPSPSQSILS